MSYARRHSTNVCPGNRVRYTRRKYEAKAQELKAQYDEAQARGDDPRAEKVQNEMLELQETRKRRCYVADV